MTLFVDVDDTLIIYDRPPPNPYGYYQGIPWRVNQPILDGIRRFHADNVEAPIIIWSGGGKEYAEMWIYRFGLAGLAVGMLKDHWALSLIQEGDIVVDDLDEPWRTHSPNQWPPEQSTGQKGSLEKGFHPG